jgi:hypothetical protein
MDDSSGPLATFFTVRWEKARFFADFRQEFHTTGSFHISLLGLFLPAPRQRSLLESRKKTIQLGFFALAG